MTETLTAALAAVQADLPIVGKDQKAVVKSDKGNYTYKYANLTSVSAAILPLLSKHGLAWTALPSIDDAGRFVLRYELRHIAGEVLSGSYPLPNTSRPQEMGSAITYARRYALCAVTGVAPEEDDDNASAAERSASFREEREIAVRDAKQLIWAEAEKREWIAEDGTYQKLADDFSAWDKVGVGAIEEADLATLKKYLTHLKPSQKLQRPKPGGGS